MARPRKPPRLNKLDNGVWEVIYFDEKVGRTARRSLATTDEAEAQKRFGDWLIRNKPKDISPDSLPVSAIIKFYRDYVQRECLSKSSALSALRQVEAFFGALPAAELSARHVKEYIAFRSEKVKPPTIRAELVKLRSAYNYAVKQEFGGIETVPAFKLPPKSPRKEDFIERHDMQALLSFLEQRRGDQPIRDEEVFVVLAFRTAGRKTALLELTWSRVHLDQKKIDLRTKEWMSLPANRKTKKRAIVPISDKLMAFLLQLKAERDPKPTDRVIRLSEKTLYSRLNAISTDSGVVVAPHLLRRTFGSLASMSGVPTLDISRVMGNSPRVAEEMYIRFNPDYLKDAVEID